MDPSGNYYELNAPPPLVSEQGNMTEGHEEVRRPSTASTATSLLSARGAPVHDYFSYQHCMVFGAIYEPQRAQPIPIATDGVVRVGPSPERFADAGRVSTYTIGMTGSAAVQHAGQPENVSSVAAGERHLHLRPPFGPHGTNITAGSRYNAQIKSENSNPPVYGNDEYVQVFNANDRHLRTPEGFVQLPYSNRWESSPNGTNSATNFGARPSPMVLVDIQRPNVGILSSTGDEGSFAHAVPWYPSNYTGLGGGYGTADIPMYHGLDSNCVHLIGPQRASVVSASTESSDNDSSLQSTSTTAATGAPVPGYPRVSVDSGMSSFTASTSTRDAGVFGQGPLIHYPPQRGVPQFNPWPGHSNTPTNVGVGLAFPSVVDRDEITAAIVSTTPVVGTEYPRARGVLGINEVPAERHPDIFNPGRPEHVPSYAHCSCCHELLMDLGQMLALHCCKTGVHISCYCIGLDMNRGVFLCPICGKEPHVSYGFDNILAAVEEEQAQLERDAQVQRDAQAARAAQIEREAQAERETQAQRHTAAQRDNPAQRNSRAQRGSQAQRDKTFRQMRG